MRRDRPRLTGKAIAAVSILTLIPAAFSLALVVLLLEPAAVSDAAGIGQSLLPGEYYYIEKMTYMPEFNGRDPLPNDIVAYAKYSSNDKWHVRRRPFDIGRIAACPGDRVEMHGRWLCRNGEPLHGGRCDAFSEAEAARIRAGYSGMTVPKGAFLIVSENGVGLVERGRIIGRPWMVIWSRGEEGIRWDRIGAFVK